MTPPLMSLDRTKTTIAVRRTLENLPPAMQKLGQHLLELLEPDGSVVTKVLHDALFPLADTKSASAQLSKLVKAIEAAAEAQGWSLQAEYVGSKQAGAAHRRLRFTGPRPDLQADTEGLDAIPPQQVVDGQRGQLYIGERKAMVLTFNNHEFTAVRHQFWTSTTAPPTLRNSNLPVDDLGMVGGVRVLHYHSEQGNRAAQRAAAELIRAYAPNMLLAVGIAFGAKEGDQKLADVLVSKFICDYEFSKVHADGRITLRGSRPRATRRLWEALLYVDQQCKNGPERGTWPTLHFGGLLSGEKLVDNGDYREQLLQLAGQNDIVGGEMEAAGIFTACEGKRVEWLVIKAICDWADGNKSQHKTRRQQDAAACAARVCHALLADGGLAEDNDDEPPPRPAKAKLDQRQHFLNDVCKEHLVHGQTGTETDLATTQEPVAGTSAPSFVLLDDLLAWVQDPQGKPLYALLGESGIGKTTTCQRLALQLKERRAAGEVWPMPLYFDLRKVERVLPTSATSAGHVPTLQESIEDCLRHGYLHSDGSVPEYTEVLTAIDDGALVILDGLDEVLSRIGDAQGLRFTANLLKLLPEAAQRAQRQGRTATTKVVISCRTQFFRNLAEQNNHFTGEHRGARPANLYRAVLVQPFSDEQILAYLAAVFPQRDPQALLDLIASVHNLRELAQRPFTLKLVAEFIPRLEEWRAQGRTITGATLYREVARQWLIRDKEKQSFKPEDKEHLAGDLAAELWRSGRRGLTAHALEQWLGQWLAAQPTHADFQQKPRELLQEDLRNSTFLKRQDRGQQSHFEFAHTSLYEFFLADFLLRALRANQRADWAGPTVSAETLDFLGQLLQEEPDAKAINTLTAWRAPYLAQASELQLRYALHAYRQGWPYPKLVGMDLQGADLSDWRFGSDDEDLPADPPRLDMQGVDLSKARLRRCRFGAVDLRGVRLDGAALTQAEFQNCRLESAVWQDADLAGGVLRRCRLGAVSESPVLAVARLIDCQGGPAPERATVAACLGLAGGDSGVESVAFAPNGQLVLSGGGSLRLWDATSGRCLRVFTGHEYEVSSVAFAPDGLRVLSGSFAGSLRLWDATSGKCLRVFTGHECEVSSVAFAPDGQRVLSGSFDGSLRLWDAASSKCLRVFSGHKGEISSVAFAPDGQRVLSGSFDGSLRLWDAVHGKCLRVFTGHDGWVNSVEFAPDGQRLLSGGNDRSLRLWDATNGECLRVFSGHEERVRSVAFSPTSGDVLSASEGSLRLWDTGSGECLCVFNGSEDWLSCAAFAPDGRRVLSGSGEGSLRLWDVASGECLRIFADNEYWINCVVFSPDGRSALSGSEDDSRLWDVESGDCRRAYSDHDGWVRSVAFAPDGRSVLSASDERGLLLWETASGECLREFTCLENSVNIVAVLAPDGRSALSGSNDGNLRLWETASGKCLRVFTGHETPVNCVVFAPDGRSVLSGSDDGSLRLWDTASGQCLWVFTGHDGPVESVAFAPDGRSVLSGSYDINLRLWAVASKECQRVFNGHDGWVSSVAFAPDGQRVLSGAHDCSLRLWDVANGECLRVFTGHQGKVRSVAFSPDGRRILSSATDGTLRLWDATSGECLRIYLHVAGGSAAWEPATNRLLHAQGSAWRYLNWFGEKDGKPAVWPLELGPVALPDSAA